jgi:carbon-monoxide dehydrogenase medium subunit
MALGARVVVEGLEERRVLSLEEFFGEHRKTVLEPGHILSEVMVSTGSPGEGAAYEAFGLRATNFITVAGVAAFLRVEEGLCTRARIALGAVAPTPLLTSTAQDALVGGPLDDKSMKKAASLARQAAAPISDIRGSADHRRELVEELCFKALEAARERAQ